MADPFSEELIRRECAAAHMRATEDIHALPPRERVLLSKAQDLAVSNAELQGAINAVTQSLKKRSYSLERQRLAVAQMEMLLNYYRDWYARAPREMLKLRPEARAFVAVLLYLLAASETLGFIRQLQQNEEHAKEAIGSMNLDEMCRGLRSAFNLLNEGAPGAMVMNYLATLIRAPNTPAPLITKADRVAPVSLSELGYRTPAEAQEVLNLASNALRFAETGTL